MKSLYFIVMRYIDGDVKINRLLAYAKGFASQYMDVHFLYLITHSDEKCPESTIPGVTNHYLWQDYKYGKYNRYVQYACSLFCIHKYIPSKSLIFVYDDDPLMLSAALLTKDCYVYAEKTEHPFAFKSSNLKNRLLNNIKIGLLKRCNGLFVISNNLYKYYSSVGIKRICIINMFVDVDRFKNVKVERQKLISYCGTVSYHKDGVDVLIKAFAKFVEKHQDYKLQIIGGAKYESELNRLKQLAKDESVSSSVLFTGLVSSDEIPRMLSESSILALARPDNLQAANGFPTKLGEYLATGRPVVVTKVGEIPFFLKDGENAILAIPDDVNDFARKLCFVADNYEKAESVGQKGLELTMKEFSNIEQSKVALEHMNSNMNKNMK